LTDHTIREHPMTPARTILRGLILASAAFAALAAVLLDSRVSALTISELNPDHGAEDGSTLAAFVDRLVAALAGAPALRS